VAAPDEEPAPSADARVRDETTPPATAADPDAIGAPDESAAPVTPEVHARPQPPAAGASAGPVGAPTPAAP
jgi:hypothetical protein